jgi:hypothetical protein
MSHPVYSRAWLALFPVVYLLHLADERYYWIGTADFATQYLGIYFTNSAWWAINVPSMLLLAGVTVLLARGRWPEWVAIPLAVHLALHGLGRVPTSLATSTVAPGLLSGLILCTPLSAATLWKARRAFSGAQWRAGVLAGVLSFQPFWHFALLPVLPRGPAV